MSAGARYHEELLALPFFEATHRAIAARANAWAAGAALDANAHAEQSAMRSMPAAGIWSPAWAPPV